jgi:hypothetical protein
MNAWAPVSSRRTPPDIVFQRGVYSSFNRSTFGPRSPRRRYSATAACVGRTGERYVSSPSAVTLLTRSSGEIMNPTLMPGLRSLLNELIVMTRDGSISRSSGTSSPS